MLFFSLYSPDDDDAQAWLDRAIEAGRAWAPFWLSSKTKEVASPVMLLLKNLEEEAPGLSAKTKMRMHTHLKKWAKTMCAEVKGWTLTDMGIDATLSKFPVSSKKARS